MKPIIISTFHLQLGQVIIGSADSVDITAIILALLGNVQNQEETLETFYYNTSGLYLMSDPIPSAGYVDRIEVDM